uniref:Uncharacterized protein n=1 Tax=Eutreptiella gymnastica TaxID=73025 RepID=A0A7S1IC69_9EUGL
MPANGTLMLPSKLQRKHITDPTFVMQTEVAMIPPMGQWREEGGREPTVRAYTWRDTTGLVVVRQVDQQPIGIADGPRYSLSRQHGKKSNDWVLHGRTEGLSTCLNPSPPLSVV